MDFYTYFINWRKAYHSARTTYHQTMFSFYDSQNEALQLWPKMMLEAYKAMVGAYVVKNLSMFQPPFDKWSANWK